MRHLIDDPNDHAAYEKGAGSNGSSRRITPSRQAVGSSAFPWRRGRRRPPALEPGSFPAARALDDLAVVNGDSGAATVILARFATLQVALQAMAGVISGPTLEDTRRLADVYLNAEVEFRPGEREALLAILDHAAAYPSTDLAAALLLAGAASRDWGHSGGGGVCYQAAYDLAYSHGWQEEYEAAARGLRLCETGRDPV